MNKITLTFGVLFVNILLFGQVKNFIDQPFLETKAEVDSLVTPDKIYLTIILNEDDNRNRKSTEELENAMQRVLKSLNIDTEKNLTLLDFSSDFKKYFLSKQQVLKSKMYSLIVNKATTAGKVLAALEEEGISNVSVEKTEYSKAEQLLLNLKTKAVLKARQNAESMIKPLNQKIGKAIFISDLNSVSNQLEGRVSEVKIRGEASIYGNQASKPIMIDFEKIKFTSKVDIKFAIE
ncbi:MAG: SIMPL domain-containing protein [Flavobacteriales bacterium]